MRRPQPRLAAGAAWSLDADGPGAQDPGPLSHGGCLRGTYPEPSRASGTGRWLEAPGPCQIEKCDASPDASLHGKGSRQIFPQDQVAKASRPSWKATHTTHPWPWYTAGWGTPTSPPLLNRNTFCMHQTAVICLLAAELGQLEPRLTGVKSCS